ncbi:hydrolase 1, exosortase A system-associated [Sedimenticola hydrogenitrophicus]|uniref:hydrolase 1, exosortase A system-associated n=1 Tax=Sedimenticola hydrogenitrophicus TaxID=2967975 RepID=UPI0023AEAD83|nr:hydrolase 1, exosortase A system-associated [Sedimenticola hydrogenitrophicus]
MKNTINTEPFFLNHQNRKLFVTLYTPSNHALDHWVLHFPAFAEEMNKSRKMVSAQARSFAGMGMTVVVPDLYGTGESGGDFSEADWSVWCADMLYLVDWMRAQGAIKIHFWGLRLGALLALDVARRLNNPVSSLLLWQPVCTGARMLTQFLRLRTVAGFMDGQQEKVSDLRTQLGQGTSLEIAGYRLSPKLANELDELNLSLMLPAAGTKINWLELTKTSDTPLPIDKQRIVESWQHHGVEITVELVAGEPFWMTPEITLVPDLILRSEEGVRAAISCPRDDGAVMDGGDLNEPVSCQTPTPEEVSENVATERPLNFACQGERLIGVIHPGRQPAQCGVLLVVGGPQYRVGSHRQFVLLARDLAESDIPVFRFDYRGMGDSSGDLIGFEGITDDIATAMDCFQHECPGLTEVVILGLCDAATAAALYAADDERVQGLVLLNPWVRSDAGEARTYIRHYYLNRLFSKGFWRKLRAGRVDYWSALNSFFELVVRATGRGSSHAVPSTADPRISQSDLSLALRLERALETFTGKVLLVLSGNDFTAAEFRQAVDASSAFQSIVAQGRFRIKQIDEADHTFSRTVWRDAVTAEIRDWLKSW